MLLKTFSVYYLMSTGCKVPKNYSLVVKTIFSQINSLRLFSNISAVSVLEKTIIQLTKRLDALDCESKTTVSATTSTSAPVQNNKQTEEEDDDDEVDLFGSDDEEVCYAHIVLRFWLFVVKWMVSIT